MSPCISDQDFATENRSGLLFYSHKVDVYSEIYSVQLKIASRENGWSLESLSTNLTPRAIVEKQAATALVVDPINGKLLWFDLYESCIMRANFDGTNKEIVFCFSKFVTVFSMKLEPISKQLYIADASNGLILKVDPNGQNLQVLVNISLLVAVKNFNLKPKDLVVDYKEK